MKSANQGSTPVLNIRDHSNYVGLNEANGK